MPKPVKTSVLELHVRNHPGVMSHITGLFARRAFNLEAIVCLPVDGGSTSRMLLLVAEDVDSNAVLGAVTGVDHVAACSDPDGGASLWSLAVDPQGTRPGVGEALVRALAAHFRARGRSYLDLSVMHDNAEAIEAVIRAYV